MKKSIITTAITLAIATSAILGNSLLVNAAAKRQGQNVSVVSVKNTANNTISNTANNSVNKEDEISNVTISKVEQIGVTTDSISKEKAVASAKKELEKKFNVSLDGNYATPIFCQRVDMTGNFWFVSFVNLNDLVEKTQVKADNSKVTEKVPANVYIAFINAKTGEAASLEKNPSSNSN